MAWVLAGAGILATLAYVLLKDDEQPRCPYCNSFVKKYARRCPQCRAKLGWKY